jgi:ubiquinone/menaquinone biosynthesis C-methylase UbiE
MGIYGEHVLPRIVDKVLSGEEIRRTRERVCSELHGDVVEIGFGSGHNAPFYSRKVTGVWAVEPSQLARRMAEKRVSKALVPVTYSGLDGQSLELPDDRFDTALSTWTLCTIPDAVAALREIGRVLKPGGTLHFVEHGRSPDDDVRKWQNRITPIQKRMGGGCHLNRDIAALVERAGFEVEKLENYYGEDEPKPFGYRYEGVARAA